MQRDRAAAQARKLAMLPGLKRVVPECSANDLHRPSEIGGTAYGTEPAGGTGADQTVFTAAKAAFCVEPRCRVIDRITLGHGDLQPPHLVRVIAGTCLAPRPERPVCIVLPSVELLAPLAAIVAAIEHLASDLPAELADYPTKLTPGTRVRLCSTGEVFEVGEFSRSLNALALHLTDKRNRTSNGKRFVFADQLALFEPTTRILPKGGSGTAFARPHMTDLDAVLGTRFFSNSGLVRTRVLVQGSRTDFQRALDGLKIRPLSGDPEAAPIASGFPFGGFGDDGVPRVTRPDGAAGRPLVATARDLSEMRRYCDGSEPGSCLVLTDRIDGVLADLDLAGRIAERQRLVVLVDAKRREDLAPLRRQRWTVWEPTPSEILGRETPTFTTGCPGTTRSLRAAEAERFRAPGYLTSAAPHVGEIDKMIERIGGLLDNECVEHEPWVEDVLAATRGAFFAAGSWLGPPTGARLEMIEADLRVLQTEAPRMRWHLGAEAGTALIDLAEAVVAFRSSIEAAGVSPKGRSLLELAANANGSGRKPVFVAGNRQNREEADVFLRANGLDQRCLAIPDLHGLDETASVIAFSVMQRDLFHRLVDPWPRGTVLFLGYAYEVDCYRRRLLRREELRARGRLDPTRRLALTGVPDEFFGNDEPLAEAASPSEEDERLTKFDRVTRDRSSSKRVTLPSGRPGEELCDVTVVRFVGRSILPMTAEHTSLVLGAAKGRASVSSARVGDLTVGSRIVVRDGGDRDIVRIIAEGQVGTATYADLRRRANLWQVALRSSDCDPQEIAAVLREQGVVRYLVTVRSWLVNDDMIGPRSEQDFRAIQEAFPLRGRGAREWDDCWKAIGDLRSLHVLAGNSLTERLAARCGRMLFEPSDTEMAVDLGIGTVWILEVSAIEDAIRQCPASHANRLIWLDQEWRQRLLAMPVQHEAA
ncbi:hypothetical protein GCM10011322_44360 [Salinarimonas ramus]|uniref:Uncharacterized protein n=2 Tax=Salinarimonas ramus TaxID=690164 RepID=A0A917V9B7_9HYPH|nr:hypothetical protein GCM10011322_44360 [Salinarimonas ramus]